MSVRRTNRFWSMSLEHTLFLDFLKLLVNMHLAASFVGGGENAFSGPTDQKLWMFEVSRRSLGRAGMYDSQPARVDHLRKKWRAEKKKKIQEKWKLLDRRRCRPVAGWRPLVAGRP
jgi:hypothetical protein